MKGRRESKAFLCWLDLLEVVGQMARPFSEGQIYWRGWTRWPGWLMLVRFTGEVECYDFTIDVVVWLDDVGQIYYQRPGGQAGWC